MACSVDRKHAAVFQCDCTAESLLFCAECAESHSQRRGRHSLKPLEATQPSANIICQTCGTEEASEICCCVYPFPLLCAECKVTHTQKEGMSSHTTAPIHCLAKMRTRGDADLYRQLLCQFDKATNQLMRSVDNITECQGHLRSICEARKNELEDYTRAQIEQLEAIKAYLQKTVGGGAKSIKAQLLDDSFSGDNLAHLVWEASRSNVFSQLCLFEYKVVPSTPSMLELVPVEWQSKVTSEGISADYSLHSPEYAIKAEISRLEEMEFQSLAGLIGMCGILANMYHESYEPFVNSYTKHYFTGSKIVEETMKHGVNAGMEKEEWVKLQRRRFATACMWQSKANYAVFEQQLIIESRKAFDYSEAHAKMSTSSSKIQQLAAENSEMEATIQAAEEKMETLRQQVTAGPFSTYSLVPDVLIFLGILLLLFFYADSWNRYYDGEEILVVGGCCGMIMALMIFIRLFSRPKWSLAIFILCGLCLGLLALLLVALAFDNTCCEQLHIVSFGISVLSITAIYRIWKLKLPT